MKRFFKITALLQSPRTFLRGGGEAEATSSVRGLYSIFTNFIFRWLCITMVNIISLLADRFLTSSLLFFQTQRMHCILMFEMTVKVLSFSISLLLITLTASCSHKFPKGNLFDIMILRKLLPASTVATTTTTTTSPTPTVNTNKYIFVTVATYNGNLGGISGADTKCQTEKTNNFAGLPGNAEDYKAILSTGTGTTRRACSTSDCTGGVSENIDWVLKANTDYYRLDGTTDTKLFTTNASGIVNFTGGSSLLTSIDISASNYWTGIDVDWTDSGFNCLNWLSSSGGQNGKRGSGSATNVNSIATAGTTACSNATTGKLLCVRQ